MKERFLNLAAASALAITTFAAPAALAADDYCYDPCSFNNGCNYCDERCISIFADYLYWNICPSSLGFATEDRPLPVRAIPPVVGTSTFEAFDLVDPINNLGGIKDRHINTKYKSGFRIGFAYHMPDCWDLEVAYTYFHPNYHAHGRACAGAHFRPCGLPETRVSIPVDLALEVPPQVFSLIAGGGTSSTCPTLPVGPLSAVTFLDPELGSSAPVTGILTSTCVSTVSPFAPITSSETPTGGLRPLIIEGTSEATNRFFVNIPEVAFDFAKLRATIKYDIVDILFARRYECGGCFDYIPYVGARIFSFEEDLHAHFGIRHNNSNSNSNLLACDSPFLLRTRYKLKLPSAGLTFGSRVNYAVCDCFDVFGHIGASILGGNAKHSFRWDNYLLNNALAQIVLPPVASGDVVVPWTIATDLPHTHRHSSHCQVIFGLDASIGIGYEWCACNFPVLIGLGYEIQSWWNMPHRRCADDCCTNGSSSLTVHGLFVRLGFGF